MALFSRNRTRVLVEVYADVAGRWRWRRKVGNEQPSAVSGEDFASKSNAVRAGEREKALYDPRRFDFEVVILDG